MAKGEDESWFRTKDAATNDHRDTMSVRMSKYAPDMAGKKPYHVTGEALSDGEDNAGNRCFPRGRGRNGESLSVDGAAAPGAPFSLDTNRAKGRPHVRRSQSTAGGVMDQAAALCCCGPRWGRKYNTVEDHNGAPEYRTDVLRTKGRWEVDADDEYFKPPLWKQIILKVKAQAREANCGSSGRAGEWVNYDPQSYEKNFDNGTWRDSSRDIYQENDENEKLGLKERALHTALLQKLASDRSQKPVDGEVQLITSDPALSPLPVRTPVKLKEEFVPIWQRRASSPVTLDVRQRS